MNDNDIASKFKVTVRILFVFSLVIVLIIHIRPNTKDPLFSTVLVMTAKIEKSGVILWCLGVLNHSHSTTVSESLE